MRLLRISTTTRAAPAVTTSVSQKGMSLLEMLMAVVMLVLFTAVVVMVSEYIIRLLKGSEHVDSSSKGLLIEQQELRLALKQFAQMLSQPGISRERMLGQSSIYPRIAYGVITSPQEACVQGDPVKLWRLPMPSVSFPTGYRICVWTTTVQESSMASLVSDLDNAKPGLYLLQALPEKLNSSMLPTRLLFCRPRPFC